MIAGMVTGPETVASPVDDAAEAASDAIAMPVSVAQVLIAARRLVDIWRGPEPFAAGMVPALFMLETTLGALGPMPGLAVLADDMRRSVEAADAAGVAWVPAHVPPWTAAGARETFCSVCGPLDSPGVHTQPDCTRYAAA